MVPGPHRQRQPWDTVLHRAVSTGVPAFFAAAAEMERDVPRFVERELNGYLDCGRYEKGCARIRCRECAHTYVIG